MAQFRNTADILDLALGNAGEVTNGNSPYETDVLNKLNRVHYAIIAGGTIPLLKDMTVEIDENWQWARAKNPIVLELQPPYTTGNVTLTLGSEAGTFSTAPSSSLEGWYIAVNGRSEMLRIHKHVAASTSFELDAAYPDSTTTSGFRAFKLDYQVVPAYLTINAENNRFQFQKVSGTTLTATLTNGVYTPADLATHVASVATTAAAGPTITGSYDSLTRKFSFVSDGAGSTTLRIVGDGSESHRSAHQILGFDDETSTAGLTQTATYILGGIARLVEPVRVHKGFTTSRITSLDTESFMRDYPFATLQEGTPDRFCVSREDADGSYTLRFNKYVKERTRIEVEYVPVPRDLKNNTSSIPLVPRKHLDVLEDAATFYLMLLKSDDRMQIYANLVQSKLLSMISQHRGTLVRSGEDFGQIIPRKDLVSRYQEPRFYYPTTPGETVQNTVATLVTQGLSYTDFQTGGLTKTVTVRTLPANRSLFAVIINLTTSFAGGAISSLLIDVGTAGNPTQFVSNFDAMQGAPAQESAVVVFFPGAETAIRVRATAVGANLNALTQGAMTFYLHEMLGS